MRGIVGTRAETQVTAEEEWPEGFDMVSELVRHMGTDWVQRCCDELTAAAREDAYEYQSITDGDGAKHG